MNVRIILFIWGLAAYVAGVVLGMEAVLPGAAGGPLGLAIAIVSMVFGARWLIRVPS